MRGQSIFRLTHCVALFTVTLTTGGCFLNRKAIEQATSQLKVTATWTDSETPLLTDREKILAQIWNNNKARQRNLFTSASFTPFVLYNFQIIAHPLLDYAVANRRPGYLDDIAGISLLALDKLQTVNKYWYFTGDYSANSGYALLPLSKSRRLWLEANGKESVLASSQFIYLISHEIRLFTEAGSEATPAMNRVISSYLPIVLDQMDHWNSGDNDGIWQVIGWRCTDTKRHTLVDFTNRAYLKQLGSNKSYCNYLDDGILQIGAAAVELLSANKTDPRKVPLSLMNRMGLASIALTVLKLFEQRLENTLVTDFKGRRLTGATLDAGAWKDHVDFRYSDLVQLSFPEPERKPAAAPKPAANVSWDLGHGMRLVPVLNSYALAKDLIDTRFSAEEWMEKFSNQIAYRVFNKNLSRPLFANYLDGSNGWYRVNYSGRSGWGYSPSGLSAEWLLAGYCSWKKFNPDLDTVCERVWAMARSTDPSLVAHRTQYFEDGLFSNYAPSHRVIFDTKPTSTSLYMLRFLAALESKE